MARNAAAQFLEPPEQRLPTNREIRAALRSANHRVQRNHQELKQLIRFAFPVRGSGRAEKATSNHDMAIEGSHTLEVPQRIHFLATRQTEFANAIPLRRFGQPGLQQQPFPRGISEYGDIWHSIRQSSNF